MRRIIASSAGSTSSSWRAASIRSRASAGVGAGPVDGMPIRWSISMVWSSVTGCSNARSRTANHMCRWPASSSQPASSRACASNNPRSRCSIAVPAMLSAKNCWRSGTAACRIIAPNPSTVPIRVRAMMTGSRTPWSRRYFDWATDGYDAGQRSRGTSRSSVPNCSTWLRCQASIAGTRKRVRGDR